MFNGLYMTEQEQLREKICLQIAQKKLSQLEAAAVLEISLRQVQRLYAAFLKDGVVGLASKKRGRASNNQLQPVVKARVLELITCERYKDFRPTFMCEKLEQLHGIKISIETTRRFMRESGVWIEKVQKSPVIHQQRKRRARFGELVQIDGSPHDWFEGRRDKCCLIVYIDDATGQTYGKFFESETTDAYMTVTAEYIKKYGRMEAVYSDKHGKFRINIPGCIHKENLTQFGRALKELDITLICANSPQAKGRVERANQTLQDRLVKEMRLAGINDIEGANEFLPAFWEVYNEKFAVKPVDPRDAHRELLPEQDLEKILCKKEYRKVSKNLEVQYKNVVYQINMGKPIRGRGLIRARVTVLETLKGEISIEYQGKPLQFQQYAQQEFQGEVVTSKEIDRFLKEKTHRKLSHNHMLRKQRLGIKKHIKCLISN